MTRKILPAIPEELAQRDLERYCHLSMELGATDARIISTSDIIIDERVRAKCIFPLCDRYGSNANCPPYAPQLELIRQTVSRYQHGIFTKLEIPPGRIAGKEARQKRWRIPYQSKNFEIVAKIEAKAFSDGYYFAMGFANGSCKSLFCDKADCTALIPGKSCRMPLKARASMEGAGIDALGMAAKLGWEVYPIGMSTSPSDVPHAVALGLILIY
jgi:predicted metal-binding protein